MRRLREMVQSRKRRELETEIFKAQKIVRMETVRGAEREPSCRNLRKQAFLNKERPRSED